MYHILIFLVSLVSESFVLLYSLSESSDENMMDAHNLSVCFGPTLMPMPPDHDQVRNQNYVNELIRILIVYHEKIFPVDTGIVYEKCMVEDEGQVLLCQQIILLIGYSHDAVICLSICHEVYCG